MRKLDETDRRLLQALSRDGRRSASALAADLKLSRQAVAERIRELERSGVIRGYRADVSPEALGLQIRAQVRLTLDSTQPLPKEKEVLALLTRNPRVRSVYRVSGEDCFVASVLCHKIEDVNALLAELRATRAIQSSRTLFVLEAVLEKDPMGPVDAALAVPAKVPEEA